MGNRIPLIMGGQRIYLAGVVKGIKKIEHKNLGYQHPHLSKEKIKVALTI